MPTVQGMHHVGFTVGDAVRSSEFYQRYFGLRELGRFNLEGEKISTSVMVEGAELLAILLASPDDSLVIEFIQYTAAAGKGYDLGNNDVGASHLCFAIDDLAGLVEQLEADGVRLNAPIAEQVEGTPMIYLQDPDGINIEVLQPGPGLRVPELLAMGR